MPRAIQIAKHNIKAFKCCDVNFMVKVLLFDGTNINTLKTKKL